MSAPAAPQPMQPGATEVAGWTNRRNTARNTYAQALLQNQFGADQATQMYQRNQAVQGRAMNNQRSTFGDSYAQRGLLKSGLYGRGLRDWYTEMAQQQSDLLNQYQGQMGQLDLQRIGASDTLASTLAGVDTEQQARTAELAAQIRGVM